MAQRIRSEFWQGVSERCLEPFLTALGHKAQRRWAPVYLLGSAGPGTDPHGYSRGMGGPKQPYSRDGRPGDRGACAAGRSLARYAAGWGVGTRTAPGDRARPLARRQGSDARS